MSIERVEKAIDEIRAGRMVILVDDEDRENEGDLCLAADKVTPDAVNFMALYGRGLICLSLTEARCDELDLHSMVGRNTSPLGTAFTVSIEAATGVSTGISAADRSRTIEVAMADETRPVDLVRPGHVFPLRARNGGVLVRTGQTEGSVDLARLAGLKPAGVICEIMNDDGTMARRPDLEKFADFHGMHICTVADIVDYRMQRESLVSRCAESEVRLGALGTFRVVAYRCQVDDEVHLAFTRGSWTPEDPVLVRVQNRDLMVDLLGAACKGGCGQPNFQTALGRIAEEGAGVAIYLGGHHGGLSEQLLARVGQGIRPTLFGDAGKMKDTEVRPDLREYGIGAQILSDLGVRRLRLMSDAPARIVGIEGFGMEMVDRVPITDEPDNVTFMSRVGTGEG